MSRKKDIYQDAGEGYSTSSLEFARNWLEQLKNATQLEVKFKADGKGDWQTYNTRFSTPLGQEFWFSGLNCGYKGEGPRTLIKVLELIGWEVNSEVIFMNAHLKIAREFPTPDKDKKKEKDDEKE